jgi:aspartate beta-hydroxylase
VCEAGAFHSVYGTDVYGRRLVPRSERRLIRAAIGEAAERLVFLFSVMARRAFTEAVEALPEIPAAGMRIPCRGRGGCRHENATRDEVAALLLLLIANEAEQACAPDGGPSPWVAHASALARKAGASSLPAPPVFDGGRAHVLPEDEAGALDAYRSGLLAMRTDPHAARRHLTRAAALLPWVGEPAVWLAYLDLQQGDTAAAGTRAAQGRDGLDRWGAPWDKRMSFEQWEWLAGFVGDRAAGPVELGPLPAPQVEALAGLPDTLRSRTRQQIFLGLRRSEEVRPGSARLQRYLASFATNESDPLMKIYPGLAARPWHDADAFPVARALTADHDAIRSEILALDQGAFIPESETIARAGSWDVLFLFERGRKAEAVCAACPVTTRALEEHGALRTMAGLVYVSRLRPGTHIAPHAGPTNLRLRCHLGIAVPPGNCAIRVEGQTRRWVEGGCIVFDDFLEHEAWNHAGTDRIVLIVDLWHPDLEPEETAVLEGLHRYAAAHAISLNDYWRANEQSRARRGPAVPARGGDESAVDYLRRLEALGTLLFHGSPRRGIERLEPRPATDDAGGAWSNDTAVYAVPAVIAAGRAILPPRDRLRGRWEIRAGRVPHPPGGPVLAVSPNVWLGAGSVYVVDKRDFHENAALHEWKCARPVPVLAEVPVTVSDYMALGGRVERSHSAAASLSRRIGGSGMARATAKEARWHRRFH